MSNLKIWRVKLPEEVIRKLVALTHVGVLLNTKYDEGQLIVDMLAVFEENRPSISRTAETYLDVFKEKRPDEPISDIICHRKDGTRCTQVTTEIDPIRGKVIRKTTYAKKLEKSEHSLEEVCHNGEAKEKREEE